MKLTLAVCLAAAVLGVSTVAADARADDAPPNAERLRSAASEYDAGRRAFGEKDYEGAASHFENAFHDAASASALRSAIRARRKGGDLARAATLASIALVQYPKDAPTVAVAQEVLKESQKKLERVALRCTPACGVAADGRAISPEDAPETVFYLEPGDHEVVVSWSADRTRTSIVTATAGREEALTFEAPQVAPKPAPVVAVPPPPPPPPSFRTLPPAVFYSVAAATAVALGITVWSGVDAEDNPGAAAVRRDCVGQGTSCAEYQQGLSAQLRTNALIGATAALGVGAGAVGIFFTRWSRGTERKPAAIDGSVMPLPGGGAFALRGAF